MADFPYNAVAILKYKSPPGADTGLSFAKGESVTVLGLADESGDWLKGRNAAGQEGIFPEQFVERSPEESSVAAQNAPVNTSAPPAAVIEQSPAKKTETPSPIEKPSPSKGPSSFKDRIAAFNKPAASPPPVIKSKPAAFQRAPKPISEVSTPPVENTAEDSKFSASDAQQSINKGGGSLKDRIAALQGLKVDANAPSAPGKAPPKPWKKPSISVPQENVAEPTPSAQPAESSDAKDELSVIQEPQDIPEKTEDTPAPSTEPTAEPKTAQPIPQTPAGPLAVPRRAGPPRKKAQSQTKAPPVPTEPVSVPEKEAEVYEKEAKLDNDQPEDSAPVEEPVGDGPPMDVDNFVANAGHDATKHSSILLDETPIVEEPKDTLDSAAEEVEEAPQESDHESLSGKADEMGAEDEAENLEEVHHSQIPSQPPPPPPAPVSTRQVASLPSSPVSERPPSPTVSRQMSRPPIPTSRPPPPPQSLSTVETTPRRPLPAILTNVEPQSSPTSSPTAMRSPSSAFRPPIPVTSPPTSPSIAMVSPPLVSPRNILSDERNLLAAEPEITEQIPQEQAPAEELSEEDEEAARRQRLAAKMASLGGMKMGMFPMAGGARMPPKRPSQSRAEPDQSDIAPKVSSPPASPYRQNFQGGFALPGISAPRPPVQAAEEAEPKPEEQPSAPLEEEEEEVAGEEAENADPAQEETGEAEEIPPDSPAIESRSYDRPLPPIGRPMSPPASPAIPIRPAHGHSHSGEGSMDSQMRVTRPPIPRSSLDHVGSSDDFAEMSQSRELPPVPRAESPSVESRPSIDSDRLSKRASTDQASLGRRSSTKESDQRVSAEGQRFSTDDLIILSQRYGSQIFAKARSKSKDGQRWPGENPSYAFSLAVLAELSDIAPPGPNFTFGQPVFAITIGSRGPPTSDTARVGDIFVAHHAKVKGKLGATTHLGTSSGPHVGIVCDDFDAKKNKVKVFDVSREGKVQESSYALDNLKEGAVIIYRALPQ